MRISSGSIALIRIFLTTLDFFFSGFFLAAVFSLAAPGFLPWAALPLPRRLFEPPPEESGLDFAAGLPFLVSAETLAEALEESATFFFALPRRLERERLRGFFSPAWPSFSCCEDGLSFPSRPLPAGDFAPEGSFFLRLDEERRRPWEPLPPWLASSPLLPPDRRRWFPAFSSVPVFFPSSPSRAPSSGRFERAGPLCEPLAGRLRLRVLLRAGFSCPPRAPSVEREASAPASPAPAEPTFPRFFCLERDRLPLERRRVGFRDPSPEDLAVVVLLFVPEEAGRRFAGLPPAESSPAPNSWLDAPELFFSVFLRTAKMVL